LHLAVQVAACVDEMTSEMTGASRAAEGKPAVVEVVVDLLLALMERAAGHTRDMCKHVLRAWSDELNAPSLELFVNVITAKEVDEDDEEDEEDDEMEEGGEEGEDDDDEDGGGDDDDDDEEDDDDDEDEDEEEEARNAERAISAALAASRDEGGDDDDEGGGDEEMPEDPKHIAAVDRQLAALVRAQVFRQWPGRAMPPSESGMPGREVPPSDSGRAGRCRPQDCGHAVAIPPCHRRLLRHTQGAAAATDSRGSGIGSHEASGGLRRPLCGRCQRHLLPSLRCRCGRRRRRRDSARAPRWSRCTSSCACSTCST